MKTRTHIARLIALTLVGGFVLSACGIRGELKTPPPLWGDQSEQPEQSPKQSDDKAKTDKQDADKRVSNT